MAGAFQRLVAFIPGLRGAARADWGGSGPESRFAIRRHLSDQLKFEVLDLSKVPFIEGWSISISHTTGMGGWIALAAAEPAGGVAGARAPRVGLDIENSSRLRPELIRRISSAQEVDLAPVPALLWCAKEAGFKGAHDQPPTLAEIQILEWSALANGAYGFRTHSGQGWCLADETHAYAVYLE